MSDEPIGRRSRRAKVKVDYAKEQEFSDEDLFEDNDQKDQEAVVSEAPKKRKKGNRKSKGRKSSSRNQDMDMFATDPFEDDAVDGYVPPKPIYTEKGYDPALPPIRERFPFLPEYELDGSPRIDLIVGRRPVEETDDKKKDLKEKSSDDDDTADDEEFGELQTNRRGRNGKRNVGGRKSSAKKNSSEIDSGKDFVEYEYLVKYKNLSYMHLEWKSGADLESMNKSAKTIYRRYLKKVAQGLDEEIENPDFDPSYVVVQKVLAEEEQELELEVEGEELVKWEKQREKELAEEDLSEEEREIEEKRQKEEEEKLLQENEAKKMEGIESQSGNKEGEIEEQQDNSKDDENEELTEGKKGWFSY